jgi:DNA-binding response OmpR family regulator
MRILLIEDDHDLGNVLKHFLQLHNVKVTHELLGTQMDFLVDAEHFDLCILDVMLPGADGFELAKQLVKKKPHLPFLFLTARGLKEDRIHGLKIGAEDYITKPFEPEELLLRIKNILKRNTHNAFHKITLGKYIFEKDNLLLYSPSCVYNLTLKESDLLSYLIKQQNCLIKKSDILITLWGSDDYFLGRSLDVFISRLRKYLHEDDHISIENVRGVGYRLKITVT